jgi:hypothetical protein
MLKKLPEILTWRSELDSPKSIYSFYLDFLASGVSNWLAYICELDASTGKSLAWQLESLPPQSRYRLITAPETYRRLVYGAGNSPTDHIGFVSESCCAERCLVQQEYLLRHPVWSAPGDFFHPTGYIEIPPGSAVEIREWMPYTVYLAPQLTSQIVLDSVSPQSIVALELGPAEQITHSAQELEIIYKRLKQTLIAIADVCPHTVDTINLIVKVIAVKRDMVAAEGFGSSSWSSIIGRVVFTNAHLSDVSLAQLANALIHEAIHSLIYMVELQCPFYLDKAGISDFTITSPWTGRTLYLTSYAHACFVWFGLRCFWQLALNSSVFARDEVNQCLERSTQGFLRGSLTAPVLPVRNAVAPELLEAIDMVQQVVIAQEAR